MTMAATSTGNYSQFVSQTNKGMLWKLMLDNDFFLNIPSNKAEIVKHEFDLKISSMASHIVPSDNLTALNKRVISEMMGEVEKYKHVEKQYVEKQYVEKQYVEKQYVEKQQDIFQEEINNKKNEFDKFSKPVPAKIDFSDTMDKPIGSEMDKILAKQIALREKQLNMVLEVQEKPAADHKWLQTETTATKLKINEKINIDNREIIKVLPKKVNFAQQENSDDFMSLLKKIPLANQESSGEYKDIKSMLEEILTKQNQILGLLIKN